MDTLILQYAVGRNDEVSLSPVLQGAAQAAGTPGPACENLCNLQELSGLGKKALEDLGEARRVLGTCQTDGELAQARGHMEAIRDDGVNLAKLLFPTRVLDWAGQGLRDGTIGHLIFRFTPALNGIPFELIYLWDEFVAFRYGVGRQLWTDHLPAAGQGAQPARALPYRAFSVVDPGRQLPPPVRKEVVADFQRFRGQHGAASLDTDQAVVSARINGERLNSQLAHSDFAVFICHHHYDKADPGGSGYILAEEKPGHAADVYTARDLLAALGPGLTPPRMLVSVSCESGITCGWENDWPASKKLYGMVDAALRVAIDHSISTLVEIPVFRSARILEPFFGELAGGRTVGEALARARRAFRLKPEDPLDGGTVLGLAFVLYGDPSRGYFCAGGHRVDRVATVQCEHRPDGTFCGRLVCLQEGGFAARRCDRHRPGGVIRCSAGHQVAAQPLLQSCTVDGCSNDFCPQCAGSATERCWFHSCANGHPVSEYARYTCSDPRGLHPEEKRTVCPLDDGWMRQLCDLCWWAELKTMAVSEVCPHCGKYVNEGNPAVGVCDGCQKSLCAHCMRWYEQTLLCPDPIISRADRDRWWLDLLSQRGQKDPALATCSLLDELAALSDLFGDKLSTNLTEQVRRRWGDLMPRLVPTAFDVLVAHSRMLGVSEHPEDLSAALARVLADDWQLPDELPGQGKGRWSPPGTWRGAFNRANRLRLHRVRGSWGEPVLVALASLAPVEFHSRRGPVQVAAHAKHLEKVRQEIERAWQSKQDGRLPDLYLVVFCAAGWAAGVHAVYAPRRLTLLVRHDGAEWQVEGPPLAGMARPVRRFVPMLSPVTLFERIQSLREWVVARLQVQDYLTVLRAQDEGGKAIGMYVRPEDVETAFDELVETGRYARDQVAGQKALRPATPKERCRQFVARWWIEPLFWFLGVITSVFFVNVRIRLLNLSHATLWEWGSMFVCTAIGHAMAQILKKIAWRIRQGR